jgi:hypothetical protein
MKWRNGSFKQLKTVTTIREDLTFEDFQFVLLSWMKHPEWVTEREGVYNIAWLQEFIQIVTKTQKDKSIQNCWRIRYYQEIAARSSAEISFVS